MSLEPHLMTHPATMKAFALTAPNAPARVVELPVPDPPADGVLIRIRAASVNGFDVFQANGYLAMMEHIFPAVIGRDFAGIVEASGSGSADVHIGAETLGFIPGAPPLHDGTFAEFVASSAAVLVPKPAGLSFETAAAIPLAGVTALDSVDAVAISPGDVVVVAGATGGVGSIALQLAVDRGATVLATARTGDEERVVRDLGASDTVDYSAGDTAGAIRARYPDGITALIDTVNRDAAFQAMAALVRDGGRIATTLGAADVEALGAGNVRATNVRGTPTPEKLSGLAAAVEKGTLRVRIQQTFSLDSAREALAGFSAGTLGKIILRIA
jgi:NADPH:quinone reductase-like Zn-dependent oxidoreductase